jgi:hypothetical protein
LGFKSGSTLILICILNSSSFQLLHKLSEKKLGEKDWSDSITPVSSPSPHDGHKAQNTQSRG